MLTMDFDAAFIALIHHLKLSFQTSTLVSVPEDILIPLQIPGQAIKSEHLPELMNAFEPDAHVNALRLDASVLAELTSVLLRFPSSEYQERLVFSFINAVQLYGSINEVCCKLNDAGIRDYNEEIIGERQNSISDQLLPTLLSHLTSVRSSKRLRWMVVQFILAVLINNNNAQQRFCEYEECRSLVTLLEDERDHVLRFLVADLLRLLISRRANLKLFCNTEAQFQTAAELVAVIQKVGNWLGNLQDFFSALDVTKSSSNDRQEIFRPYAVEINNNSQLDSTTNVRVIIAEDITFVSLTLSNCIEVMSAFIQDKPRPIVSTEREGTRAVHICHFETNSARSFTICRGVKHKLSAMKMCCESRVVAERMRDTIIDTRKDVSRILPTYLSTEPMNLQYAKRSTAAVEVGNLSDDEESNDYGLDGYSSQSRVQPDGSPLPPQSRIPDEADQISRTSRSGRPSSSGMSRNGSSPELHGAPHSSFAERLRLSQLQTRESLLQDQRTNDRRKHSQEAGATQRPQQNKIGGRRASIGTIANDSPPASHSVPTPIVLLTESAKSKVQKPQDSTPQKNRAKRQSSAFSSAPISNHNAAIQAPQPRITNKGRSVKLRKPQSKPKPSTNLRGPVARLQEPSDTQNTRDVVGTSDMSKLKRRGNVEANKSAGTAENAASQKKSTSFDFPEQQEDDDEEYRPQCKRPKTKHKKESNQVTATQSLDGSSKTDLVAGGTKQAKSNGFRGRGRGRKAEPKQATAASSREKRSAKSASYIDSSDTSDTDASTKENTSPVLSKQKPKDKIVIEVEIGANKEQVNQGPTPTRSEKHVKSLKTQSFAKIDAGNHDNDGHLERNFTEEPEADSAHIEEPLHNRNQKVVQSPLTTKGNNSKDPIDLSTIESGTTLVQDSNPAPTCTHNIPLPDIDVKTVSPSSRAESDSQIRDKNSSIAPQTPFGNPKRFVANVNTSKSIQVTYKAKPLVMGLSSEQTARKVQSANPEYAGETSARILFENKVVVTSDSGVRVTENRQTVDNTQIPFVHRSSPKQALKSRTPPGEAEKRLESRSHSIHEPNDQSILKNLPLVPSGGIGGGPDDQLASNALNTAKSYASANATDLKANMLRTQPTESAIEQEAEISTVAAKTHLYQSDQSSQQQQRTRQTQDAENAGYPGLRTSDKPASLSKRSNIIDNGLHAVPKTPNINKLGFNAADKSKIAASESIRTSKSFKIIDNADSSLPSETLSKTPIVHFTSNGPKNQGILISRDSNTGSRTSFLQSEHRRHNAPKARSKISENATERTPSKSPIGTSLVTTNDSVNHDDSAAITTYSDNEQDVTTAEDQGSYVNDAHAISEDAKKLILAAAKSNTNAQQQTSSSPTSASESAVNAEREIVDVSDDTVDGQDKSDFSPSEESEDGSVEQGRSTLQTSDHNKFLVPPAGVPTGNSMTDKNLSSTRNGNPLVGTDLNQSQPYDKSRARESIGFSGMLDSSYPHAAKTVQTASFKRSQKTALPSRTQISPNISSQRSLTTQKPSLSASYKTSVLRASDVQNVLTLSKEPAHMVGLMPPPPTIVESARKTGTNEMNKSKSLHMTKAFADGTETIPERVPSIIRPFIPVRITPRERHSVIVDPDVESVLEIPAGTPAPFTSVVEGEVQSIARQGRAQVTDLPSQAADSFLEDDGSTLLNDKIKTNSRGRMSVSFARERFIRDDSEVTDDVFSSPSARNPNPRGAEEQSWRNATNPLRRDLFNTVIGIANDVLFRLGHEEDAIDCKIDSFERGGGNFLSNMSECWQKHFEHEAKTMLQDIEAHHVVTADLAKAYKKDEHNWSDKLRFDENRKMLQSRKVNLLEQIEALMAGK